MRVYITGDMEGSSCIASPEQCSKESPLFAHGSRLYAGDLMAAVDGCIEGGADEVIVADMHDGSFNIPHDMIHPKARYVFGGPHSAPRFPFLDESVDCFMCVAYHAMSGTAGATLEHTMSSVAWQEFAVNGRPIGEFGIDAGLAGCVGVPTVLVTGDDKVCAEAAELVPGVEAAVVKWGVGRTRAMCLSPEESRARIRRAAARAVKRVGEFEPVDFGSPVEIRLRYSRPSALDGVRFTEDVRRVDGQTVLYRHERLSDHWGGTWPEAGIPPKAPLE